VAKSQDIKKPPFGSETELSRGKRMFFSVLSLVIPFFMLVLLEVGLRIGGYGEYPPLFKPIPGYEAYLQPDERVAARYFTSIENIPGIPFDSFRKEKDPDAIRIVVQGGSTAAGFPFYFGGSFPDMLEQRLLMTFPGRPIEVINTAMAAVNSYTLLDFTDEILEHDPDAILIYAGHNEYYGALGVGSSQLLGTNPALIHLYLGLKRFRTTQLLQSVIRGVVGLFSSSSDDGPAGATLMQNMVGEQRIPLDSELYEAGLNQFSYNLDRLLETYQEAGIPVFIGTVASNERDHRPFISGSGAREAAEAGSGDTRSNTEIESTIREAVGLFASGDSTRGMESISSVIAEHPTYASAYFARGRMSEALGSFNSAREDYQIAKEYDELRFRAPAALNTIIREKATAHGATLVETEEALRAASQNGIIGSYLMLEHLHPTIQGYFVIADAFYDALAEVDFGAESASGWETEIGDRAARTNLLITPLDSLVGVYRIQQLMANWPFQPVGGSTVQFDTLHAETAVGDLALRLYQKDIRRIDALDALQQTATRVGDYVMALQSIFAIIQRYPFLPGPYLSAANIQMGIGRLAEAEQYVLASLERGDSSEGRQILGSLLLNKNMPEESLPHLEQALVLEPGNMGARYNLAGALALLQRYDEARVQAETVLRDHPDNVDARRLLESLPR